MDPLHTIHILCFITPNILPIFVMIMVTLAIFQPWILVEGGIGKFLIDRGGKNIFDTKITWSGSVRTSGWLSVSLHYSNGLNGVMD